MVGLGELSLPESLAGRLESQIEARARVESQSVESFRRLDVFLGGLLAVLQQMDADMQRCRCPFKHDAPHAIHPARTLVDSCPLTSSPRTPYPVPVSSSLCSVKQENGRLAAQVKQVSPAPRPALCSVARRIAAQF